MGFEAEFSKMKVGDFYMAYDGKAWGLVQIKEIVYETTDHYYAYVITNTGNKYFKHYSGGGAPLNFVSDNKYRRLMNLTKEDKERYWANILSGEI